MNLLPPTKNKPLIFLTAIGCLFISVPLYLASAAYLGGHTGPVPIAPFFLLLFLIGLWRLVDWVRKTLTALVVVYAVFAPIGIINPFAAMDMPDPPPLSELLIQTYTPIALALLYVYLLGRYRQEFRKTFL